MAKKVDSPLPGGTDGTPQVDAPTGLKKHAKKADRIGRDPARVRRLLAEAATKAAASRDRLGDAWDDLQTLFRLLKAWASGRYREVPWKVVVLSIAAILYFVNPLDLIPDFLGIGLLDDIGVLGLAMSQMKTDLEAFRGWEKTTGVKVKAGATGRRADG